MKAITITFSIKLKNILPITIQTYRLSNKFYTDRVNACTFQTDNKLLEEHFVCNSWSKKISIHFVEGYVSFR